MFRSSPIVNSSQQQPLNYRNNHNRRNNSKMDSDIPIATATVVMSPPAATAAATAPPQRPGLTKGRSSRVMMPKQQSYKLQERELVELQQQGFPRGLAQTLTRNNQLFPLRIWVVDNSGSMNIRDGHRILESASSQQQVKVVSCTRWAEIQQTVEYHAQMAALLQAPTVFRLLNDPGKIIGPMQFSIAENTTSMDQDLAIAMQTMKNVSPGGVTPLSAHVREIRNNVQAMEATLREEGTRVSIILATDGLPTDAQGRCDASTKREFIDALRSLEGLPVWVVVRLCTDEEDVVQFYNDLDNNLELSLEVLDDFMEEAAEVTAENKWLNYALPLHRCREMGYHSRLFDLLDERQLTPTELRDFLFLLFGSEHFDGVPDPQANWKGFVKAISTIVAREKKQWNPVTKKVEPWINMRKLEKAYNKKGGCSIM